MPYIPQCKRKTYDEIIEQLHFYIDLPGELNYVLYSLACRMKPSYTNYRNFLGELSECSAEIRRRLLAPYEDERIKNNGDIYVTG